MHAHTGENMEDKKDRTPKHGSPIIPNFIKKVERTEEEIDANTPSITGDSQAADIDQRPRFASRLINPEGVKLNRKLLKFNC